MKRDLLRQLVTVIGVVATILVNALANALPLNGQQTGEVSDQFPIYFVPAGYVFAIWGVIYLGLIAYAIFQALPSQRENGRQRSIGGLFAVASLANVAWIFAWHYEQFPLTEALMLILLAALLGIYLRLGTGRARLSTAETWAMQAPFSIYLGWITVATIANTSQLLYVLGWDGWGISPIAWTIIMLAAATVIAALIALTRRDVAYLAVLVWAIIGIALKHAATPAVSLTAWAATGIIALLLIWSAVSRLRRKA